MKKLAPIALAIAVVFCVEASAQRRRQPARQRPAPRARKPATPAARMVGQPVVITTRNGDRLRGTLLDLSAFSIRFRADNLESTLPLDGIAAIVFDESVGVGERREAGTGPNFARDTQNVLEAFRNMEENVKSGVDYIGYGQAVNELRRAADRYTGKYATSDNPAETRKAALVAGAMNDYNWARILWNFKLGRSSDGTVSESDSPAVTDVLALYPELRQAATGNRYQVDKLINGLWREAAEKCAKARAVVAAQR